MVYFHNRTSSLTIYLHIVISVAKVLKREKKLRTRFVCKCFYSRQLVRLFKGLPANGTIRCTFANSAMSHAFVTSKFVQMFYVLLAWVSLNMVKDVFVI